MAQLSKEEIPRYHPGDPEFVSSAGAVQGSGKIGLPQNETNQDERKKNMSQVFLSEITLIFYTCISSMLEILPV